MNPRLSRFAVCFALALLPFSLWADVKMRPGDKTSDNTKDFIKDRKKNGYPTPEPHDKTVNFTTGQTLDIELDVATSYLGTVKFTIRDQPEHGKLSEIKRHPSGESNKALITYTHGGDPEQVADKFTFQVKIEEGNTSAPGTITLVGKRAVAKLEVLEPARFKRLQPGESDAGRVVVINTGTAPFNAEVTWPKPFVGPPRLELAINEKQSFMLLITAPAPGAYRVDQELQPGVPTSKVQAYVECVQPFTATPSALTLGFDALKGSRSGMVKISNGSPTPLKLRLEAPGRLQVTKELTIEPKSAKDVIVALDGKDVALFHGELWIIQEPHREKVMIHAEPEPAQIRLENPAHSAVNFGKVEKGKKGESTITVVNDGGAPAILKLSGSPPFSLISKQGSANPTIEAGKSLPLTLLFAPEQPGNFDGSLTIAGNAGRVDITAQGLMYDPKRPATMAPGVENPHTPARPVAAAPVKPRESASRPRSMAKAVEIETPSSLSKPPPAPAPVPRPAPGVAASADGAAPAPGNALNSMQRMDSKAAMFYGHMATFGFGLESLPEFKSKILDPVPAIGVSEAGRDYVVLTWTAPKVEPKKYLIQASLLVRNEATGMPMKSWRNVDGWKPVNVPAGTAAARIDGLRPDTEYELRVLGVDHQGKLSPSSDLLRVFTQPPFIIPGWVWQLLIGVAIAVVVLVTRRVREQRAYA